MRWLICVALTASVLVGVHSARGEQEQAMLSKIDHLVYAAPDLAAGIERVEKLLGVRSVPGGQHPGAGTRNALIGLGSGTYLEIIGPDPSQPKPQQPRRFGIDDLQAPRLVTWAAKSADLSAIVKAAKDHGVDLGSIQAGSRKRPDGVLLAWKLTSSAQLSAGGVIPFFIDWGQTPHPAADLPTGCTLVALRAEHPDAQRVQTELAGIGLNLHVDPGATPALIATIKTPRGEVELR